MRRAVTTARPMNDRLHIRRCFRDPQSQFVWMPVIGKHEPERLNKIHTQIGKAKAASTIDKVGNWSSKPKLR